MLNFIAENTLVILLVAIAFLILAVIFEFSKRTNYHIHRIKEKPHSKRIDRAIAHFRKSKTEKITNDAWQKITKISDPTAIRDLAKLVELGVLKKQGRGRSIHYTFVKHK